MTSPHERLDAAIDERRLELGMGWKELAEVVGIADVTLRNIRKGRNQPTSLNKRRLEDALRWEHGSIEAVLSGGDPTPLGERTPDEDAERRRIERLPAEERHRMYQDRITRLANELINAVNEYGREEQADQDKGDREQGSA